MATTQKSALITKIDKKPEIRQFTTAEAAWLAAVIDGEGSFGLYNYGKEGRRVMIQMGNTNKSFVEEMRRVIGCGSSIRRVSFGKRYPKLCVERLSKMLLGFISNC